MACGECHQSLNDKSDGDIDKITSQQIRHAGADAGCQECGYRVQKHAAENHDGVAGMDVTACTGGGDADGHSGHTGQGCKEGGQHQFFSRETFRHRDTS